MNLIISSVKGGVGKTTVTVGLARAFQRKGRRVGILDLDYRSPSVPLALGLDSGALTRREDDALVPARIQEISVFSMAYIWPDGKCVMVEDADAVEDVRQLLAPGTIAWPELDVLVVDSPPTSSGIVLTAMGMPGLTGAVTVTQSSSVSRAAFLRTLDLFSECRVPIFGVVCNQSVDEDGRQRYDLTVQDIERVSVENSIPVFISIPHAANLDRYFDDLAGRLAGVKPIIIPRKEPGDKAWKKLVELSRKLT